uniref:hypothetical protein n=1 Tax=Streptomyces polyasparticus TaxID=2767826 RepID=UPI00165A7343|nr:hypothetical protein [Streptomyces polyasparticus]
MNRIRIGVISVAAAILLGAGALTAVASDVPPPPANPEWVMENGRVDESLVPEEFTVVDAEGEIMTDTAGNPITVDNGSDTPEFDPRPPCARCPAPEPPTDAGDTHNTGIDENNYLDESVEVNEDSPFIP